MIGTTVSHYKIIEKLGEGGMGEVWKAQDTRLDRFVAIKFVPQKTAEDASTVERFLREARAASALNHPNICTIFDVGEWEGRRYIVMELLRGGTLLDHLAHGPFEMERLIETAIQLADALDVAHDNHIIHRDIKTTNIMLSDRGKATILDFGLAKIIEAKDQAATAEDEAAPTIARKQDLTGLGQAVGTVGTMSPEQALGKEVDGRTDIFSLGVVLYELATGKRPFPGSTSAAVFDAILNKAPVAPITLNSNVPVELQRILNKMLEKDRDLRYGSASEIVTDLKRLRRDSGSQPSVAIPAVVAAPKRGSRKWIGLAAVVALVAVAVVVVLQMNRAPAETPLGPLTSKGLTSMVGVEGDGTWSPDGSFFAYSHSAFGPMDIFIQSVAGGDPVRLVESPADDQSPRWSPDNRWIVFQSTRDGRNGLYLVPPLGGVPQLLLAIPGGALSGDRVLGAMPWSPDGKQLLVAIPSETGSSAIWKLDVASREKTQISRPEGVEVHFNAAWSFDGKQIAYVALGQTDGGIHVMDPDGSNDRVVLTDELLGGVTWTPDSQSLVYDFELGGNSDIWLLNLDSLSKRSLTSGAGSEGGSVVSRTGDLLYGTFSHQTDLYERELATGEERRLTAHTTHNFGAHYAPDGKQVVYMSARTGDGEIWVIDLDAVAERRITDDPAMEREGVFTADGQEIIFASFRGDKPGLWRVSARGGAATEIQGAEMGMLPRVSPDGRMLGFLSMASGGKPTLRVMPVTGGDSREVVRDVVDFGWYLDSNRVIATVVEGEGTGEMRAVNLETGSQEVLFDGAHIELMVAPDGTAVSFCSAVSHYNMNLHFLPLNPPSSPDGLPTVAGPAEQITAGKGEWHVHNGDWAPDMKRVVYTRDTDTGDLFMIEGLFEPAP